MEREGEKAPLALPLLLLFYSICLSAPALLLSALSPPLPDLLLLGAVQLLLYTLCAQNQPNETQQQHFTSWLECSVCGGATGLGSASKGCQTA